MKVEILEHSQVERSEFDNKSSDCRIEEYISLSVDTASGNFFLLYPFSDFESDLKERQENSVSKLTFIG